MFMLECIILDVLYVIDFGSQTCIKKCVRVCIILFIEKGPFTHAELHGINQ